MATDAARSAPDKRPWQYFARYLGQIAGTRRNPASQTIILRLSQCSSKAWCAVRPAISPGPHFPVKSGTIGLFAAPERLTAGLPDVGTDRLFRRNLIRPSRSGGSGVRFA